jgi:hypothetical protein
MKGKPSCPTHRSEPSVQTQEPQKQASQAGIRMGLRTATVHPTATPPCRSGQAAFLLPSRSPVRWRNSGSGIRQATRCPERPKRATCSPDLDLLGPTRRSLLPCHPALCPRRSTRCRACRTLRDRRAIACSTCGCSLSSTFPLSTQRAGVYAVDTRTESCVIPA